MSETQVDLQRVLREIDEEVRARRAAGDFPPGMEKELDLVFARFAPPAAAGDDLDAVIEAADRTAYIDPIPPVASRLPAVSLLKRVEHRLLGWYMRFVSQQVTAFAGVVVQALKLVSKRLEALEDAVPATNPALVSLSGGATRPATTGPVADAVADFLRGTAGRVLVAECGDGALLRHLEPLDVYGIEPRVDLAESAALTGLDVREGDVLGHLRGVADGGLGGAVLAGAVDRAPLPAKLGMIERLATALTSGGRLVLVGTDPDGWGLGNPVEADLAPGRPLHPATWVHLLTEHGFEGCQVVDALGTYAVTCTKR
jgi:SAM-dependent methyltransferase